MTTVPTRVLLIEDNPGDARLVQLALADHAPGEFAITTVERLGDALAQIAAQRFTAVLADLGLPDSTGLASVSSIAEHAPALPLVVLTGSGDEQLGRQAIRQGAQDYLVKGISNGESIARALRYAIERKRLENALREANESLERRVTEQTAALTLEIRERAELQTRLETERREGAELLQQTYLATIQAIALALEKRDAYTSGHQRRASELAVAIARELGLAPEKIEGLRVTGLLYDLGKISVPADIINRARPLNKSERALIHAHVQSGYDIVRGVRFPWPVAEIVLQHHERLDGSGYPAGLANGAILLEARILAIADVVEAMCSHRPYRAALGIDAALDEIGKNSGVLYDADAVHACIRLFREQGFAFGQGNRGQTGMALT